MARRNEFVRPNFRSQAAIRSAAPEFTNPTNFGSFQKFLSSKGGGGRGAGIDVAGILAGMQLAYKPEFQQANTALQLTGVSGEPISTGTSYPGADEEAGIFSRLMASIDAPQNAVTNIFESLITSDEENPTLGSALKEAGSDIAGGVGNILGAAYQISPLNALPHFIPGTEALDKLAAQANPANSVANIIRKKSPHFAESHPWITEGVGFAGDVLTDPLTYIPLTGPGKAIKTLFRGKAQSKLDEVERLAQLEKPEDILERAAAGQPTFPKNRVQTTGVADDIQDVRIIHKKPLVDVLEEGAVKVGGADSAKYLTPNASSQISGDIAAKFRDEARLVNESKLAASGETSADELVDAANRVDEIKPAFVSAKAQGSDTAENLVQANLFQQFLDEGIQLYRTKKGGVSFAKAFDHAVRKYKTAEDQLIAQSVPLDPTNPAKFTFQYGDETLQLSDVIAKFPRPKGKRDFESLKNLLGEFSQRAPNPNPHPVIQQAYREAQVSSVMERPGFFEGFSAALEKRIGQAQKKYGGPLTPDQYRVAVKKSAGDAVRNSAMRSPRLNVKEANELSKIVQRHLNDVPATKMERMYQKRAEATLAGKGSAETADAQTRNIETVTGSLKTLVTEKGMPKAVAVTINGRLGTWMKEHVITWSDTAGLFPNFKRSIAHASLSANFRSRRARALLRDFDDDTIKEAYRMHRGLTEGAASVSPEVQKAYEVMDEWMTYMFGKSTLGKLGFMQKSGLLIDDANRELARLWGKETKDFRFRNDIFTDENGKVWDFRHPDAGGEGWWNSWKAWDVSKMPKHKVSNPVHMLHDVDLAIERKARLTASLEDAGARFARKTPSDDFTHQVRDPRTGKPHPALENKYFTKEVAEGIENILTHYNKGSWVPSSQFGKTWAKVLRAWKTSVTIYLPSHHARNLIGDSWLMWQAGHSNPYDFIRGLRTVNAFKHRYKAVQTSGTWDNIYDEFIDPDVINTKASSIIFRKGGKDFHADELYQAAYKRGILLEIDDLEDIATEGLAPIFREKPGAFRKFHRGAQSFSAYREHFIRLSHFIAAVKKGYKPGMKNDSLMKLYDDAADEVVKWHPDGTDMTQWEQKWMKNLFPFYSWQRKSIPLIVESFLTNPAKIIAIPRAQLAVSSALGLQEDNPEHDLLDPFPDTRRYPSWVRATGLAPFGMYGAPGAAGWLANLGEPGTLTGTQSQTGSTVWNPGIPFNELIADFGGIGKWNTPLYGAAQMLNPAFRIPMEVATGEKLSNAPIDPHQYAVEQVPGVNIINRLFPGANIPLINTTYSKEQQAKKSGKPYSLEDLINIFTGLQLSGTGQYIKRSEFEAKERAGG